MYFLPQTVPGTYVMSFLIKDMHPFVSYSLEHRSREAHSCPEVGRRVDDVCLMFFFDKIRANTLSFSPDTKLLAVLFLPLISLDLF